MRYKITKDDFISLLQYLLKEGIVEEVMSGEEKRNHYTITPTFTADPEELKKFPLSQLLVMGNVILHQMNYYTPRKA
jgi:hypothetical protein